jgi:hypothetical protein
MQYFLIRVRVRELSIPIKQSVALFLLSSVLLPHPR